MQHNQMHIELMNKQFVQREYGIIHPTYDSELAFYQLVSAGDIKALEARTDYESVNSKERGILSDNPLRNLKYHIIVSITMISRFCIENGMSEQESYALSDSYIKAIDECVDEAGARKIHHDVIFDYAKRMKKLQKQQIISVHCIKAMDYIYDHLHENIQVADVADYLGLERSYFSKLFHREMGQTISQFIASKKIETAKQMLMYSEFTCSEIAQYLSFSDNSHFASSFHKHTGTTPSNYRKVHYRKHWTQSE
ncbi:MAG: helix-turn-helix domain-containing protein [Eubacteriales bacterium]|nr:helix-turn-helix domain-containing protein [Eubacteriales bacterium]